MTHQELSDLLPLYVLGGLEPEAVTQVERHLAEPCDDCTAEVRTWHEVVGLIPLGLTPSGPSPAVKEQLMARVRQAELAEQAEQARQEKQDRKVVLLASRRRLMSWVAAPLALAASLLLTIGGIRYQALRQEAAEQMALRQTVEALLAQEQQKLASQEAVIERLTTRLAARESAGEETGQRIAQLEASLAEQRQLVGQQEQELAQRTQELARTQRESARERAATAALERRVAALQADLARGRAELASSQQAVQQLQATLEQQRARVVASQREAEQFRVALARQRQVIDVLSAPGLRVSHLGWAQRGVDSRGHVVWNEHKQTWLFYAFGMPRPPTGKEYQVWFMTEKEGPVSAGLFLPDDNGAGSVIAQSPSPRFGQVTAAAVTLEPAGGRPKPSGSMYLRGAL